MALSLVDYAENYLTVFEVASHEEKTKHAVQLFDAANNTAQHVGAKDFLSLIDVSNIEELGKAAVYSRQRFDEIATPGQGRYWLATYALTHLMILNYLKSFEDTPHAKRTAENAAHLYAAEYARRKMSS